VSDGIQFDFAEVLKLAADLGKAPTDSGLNIRKAVEITARHVKDDWRKDLTGARGIPHGAASISYDIKGGEAIRGSAIEAEIGPELEGQGSIVGLVEYGTPTLGPRGYGAGALQRNQQDFIDGLEKAIGDVL
jgi:hypothetical protein